MPAGGCVETRTLYGSCVKKLDITSCVRRVALENTDRLCLMSLYIMCRPHRVNFM